MRGRVAATKCLLVESSSPQLRATAHRTRRELSEQAAPPHEPLRPAGCTGFEGRGRVEWFGTKLNGIRKSTRKSLFLSIGMIRKFLWRRGGCEGRPWEAGMMAMMAMMERLRWFLTFCGHQFTHVRGVAAAASTLNARRGQCDGFGCEKDG